MSEDRPPIMAAWRHTIALLPQEALNAMDEFYREMGLDPDGRHAFPCAAGKHETAMKFAYSGAWTADKTETIDELAADLYTKFEMLTQPPPADGDDDEEPTPLNRTAAGAAYRAANRAWLAMNAAGMPDETRVKRALVQFKEELEARIPPRSEPPPDPEADARYFANRYIEAMQQPDAVTDRWAACIHNQGTPDFHSHIVPNPMPPEDRPLAYARFQMAGAVAKWPAEDGGTIEFCPCLTCRAAAVRRMREGGNR